MQVLDMYGEPFLLTGIYHGAEKFQPALQIKFAFGPNLKIELEPILLLHPKGTKQAFQGIPILSKLFAVFPWKWVVFVGFRKRKVLIQDDGKISNMFTRNVPCRGTRSVKNT